RVGVGAALRVVRDRVLPADAGGGGMSANLTKVIARAGQIATLFSERGFPVSSVTAHGDGITIHLDRDARKRSAYWALTTAGVEVSRLTHRTGENSFSVAVGTYRGTEVRVFGAHEPDAALTPGKVTA